jgi:hypothetical protein
VSRADYGVLALSLHTEPVSVLATVPRTIGSIGSALGGSVTDLTVYGAIVLTAIAAFAERPKDVPRTSWWGLWASIAAATVLFPAAQNIDPGSAFGRWILERFDLLPLLLWSIPTATVIDRAWRAASRASLKWAMGAVGIALAVGHGVGIHDRGRPARERAIEQHAIDMLRSPGGPAIIFGTDDHRTFPALYAREVLGVAPDVVYVDASLLAHSWYRDRVAARWPGLPVRDKPLRTMGAIWEEMGEDAPPIYLANVFSRPSAELPRVPEGLLWRVVPPSEHPSPEQVAAQAVAAYDRCATTPAHFAEPRSPWAEDLWHAYVDKGRTLAAQLRRSGESQAARRVESALSRCVGAAVFEEDGV